MLLSKRLALRPITKKQKQPSILWRLSQGEYQECLDDSSSDDDGDDDDDDDFGDYESDLTF